MQYLYDFRIKILKCIEMNDIEYQSMCENAYFFINNNYSYETVAKKYTNILENEVERFKKTSRVYF
jgi:hypothetical protein